MPAEKMPEMQNCDVVHVRKRRLWVIAYAVETDRQTESLQPSSCQGGLGLRAPSGSGLFGAGCHHRLTFSDLWAHPDPPHIPATHRLLFPTVSSLTRPPSRPDITRAAHNSNLFQCVTRNPNSSQVWAVDLKSHWPPRL